MITMPGSTWDNRFIDLALHIAQWSKDDSSKVGAVIADGKRIVSVGFNGYPAGVEDQILSREQKLLRTIHAEANALHFANRDVQGCRIYVTHPPCSHCAAHIIQRGMGSVVWVKPDAHFISRWGDSMDESVRMFREAGVEFFSIGREVV